MPRTARASVGEMCYHVINHGNGRARVFHKQADYAAFVELIAEACARRPMRALAYALLTNHFHLVLFPKHDGDLSRWLQWQMTAHVRRYQGRLKTSQKQFEAYMRQAMQTKAASPMEWASRMMQAFQALHQPPARSCPSPRYLVRRPMNRTKPWTIYGSNWRPFNAGSRNLVRPDGGKRDSTPAKG